MLRREITIEGRPHWQLIPQIEHARLSGELAEAYQPLAVSPLRDSLLKAVHHHDDGWREWDEAPELDEQGRPLTFSEVDRATSLAIWERSISRTLTRDFTAAYFVAEHFKQLLLRDENAQADPECRRWLEEMADTQMLAASEIGKAELDRYQEVVPGFDALSLWMCEAIMRDEPSFELTCGNGKAITFTRQARWQFTAKPWPFEGPQLNGSLEAKLVPVARYKNTSELLPAATVEQIEWQMNK
ncbi:MAG: DUF3891 family protein [Lacipirellulaceae bacterium]